MPPCTTPREPTTTRKAESAEIVRAIYAYHAQTLGWCDIGYNALVDKYGQIFEGRAGGLDRPVQGAHAGGFNENTIGVAMMGDFTIRVPPQATLDAVGKFLGWRLQGRGLDPTGSHDDVLRGHRIHARTRRVRPSICRSSSRTATSATPSCPGDAAYAQHGRDPDIAAASLGGGNPALAADAPSGEAPAPSGGPGTDASSSLGSGIPALVNELLRLTDPSPVAQKWVAEGGDAGRLGRPSPDAAGQGRELGAHSSPTAPSSPRPNGGVWAVLGQIFETWQNLGADYGELGLPTSDEYPVPGGLRTDFENGSLIFNELTGIVTTVLKTYNDTYAEAYKNGARVDAAAPVAPPADPGRFRRLRGIPLRLRLRLPNRLPHPHPSRRHRFRPADRVSPLGRWWSQDHQRSSTRATPSSEFEAVTSSAAAIASGCAFSIGHPVPGETQHRHVVRHVAEGDDPDGSRRAVAPPARDPTPW